MNGRTIVVGFVASVSLAVGWAAFETISGAVLFAAFVLGVFLVNWLVDDYLYGP